MLIFAVIGMITVFGLCILGIATICEGISSIKTTK